jgi:signal transduction histidine kinase
LHQLADSVFDRFRQQDGSVGRRHGGLGRGPSIVKNLVELHGGEIRALSARRALRSGYQAHIAKPVEPSELVYLVAGLAGRTARISSP